jgi:hypothetical protein
MYVQSKSTQNFLKYLEDEIIPLWDDVTQRTAMVRLAEGHTTIHTPVTKQENRSRLFVFYDMERSNTDQQL